MRKKLQKSLYMDQWEECFEKENKPEDCIMTKQGQEIIDFFKQWESLYKEFNGAIKCHGYTNEFEIAEYMMLLFAPLNKWEIKEDVTFYHDWKYTLQIKPIDIICYSKFDREHLQRLMDAKENAEKDK